MLGVGFVLLPLAGVVAQVPWGRIGELLTAPASLDALWLSLRTALVSTSLVVILGVPLALVVVSVPGRFGSVLRTLVLVPLVLPPVVSGLALLAAFGKQGLLGSTFGGHIAYTTLAVVLAQAFVSMPYLVLALDGALRSRDTRLDDMAAALGATPTRVLLRVTLPLIAPSLATGAVLSFARALGEFGATLTFAGSLQGVTRTLPLEIYLQRELDPDAALALSLLLIAIAVVIVAAVHGRPGAPRRGAVRDAVSARDEEATGPASVQPSPGVAAPAEPRLSTEAAPAAASAPGSAGADLGAVGADAEPSAARPHAVSVAASVPERGVQLDVDLPAGEVVAVVGPNGAGKSTLLGVVSGLVAARPARVDIGGTDVSRRPPHRRGIGLLAQDGLLFPHLDVLDNVAFGLRCRRLGRAEARERARAELAALGIEHLADRRPGTLSGGQAQRVALARALATRPDVLLLDEPLAALDVAGAAQMRTELARLQATRPLTTLLVTHDLDDVRALADRVVVMECGRVVEQGPTDAVLAAPTSAFARRFGR